MPWLNVCQHRKPHPKNGARLVFTCDANGYCPACVPVKAERTKGKKNASV
jgi:hypothetical protein